MKLPEFLKQIEFLTNGMTPAQMEKIGMTFEYFDEHGQFIKCRHIKYVELDERFNKIVFTEDNENEDDIPRLTDDYSRD